MRPLYNVWELIHPTTDLNNNTSETASKRPSGHIPGDSREVLLRTKMYRGVSVKIGWQIQQIKDHLRLESQTCPWNGFMIFPGLSVPRGTTMYYEALQSTTTHHEVLRHTPRY